ncbi:hypothetical protein ABZY09_07115 [Streptomyces sp. NPDC002928]|uniref:hypothetical protein n=1 Tax=Streptomyces sp. NPDC002928 TaxID=3154440 RepID=UPI0033A310CC
MGVGPFGDGEEDGVEPSGGQWQRVAPARAPLREDPGLLILDEPTSGLDPEAGHEVHEALRRHRRGRTSRRTRAPTGRRGRGPSGRGAS